MQDAYVVGFVDSIGNPHFVSFRKDQPEANKKAEKLMEALAAIGLDAVKLGAFQKPGPNYGR